MYRATYPDETERKFLDKQPELQSAIREWLEGLSISAAYWGSCGHAEIEEIECRSRDGFIRASHNFGGFDLQYMSTVDMCHGSGAGPNLKEIDRQIEQAYKEAIEWFKDQAFIGLEHLKDEEITYKNLYDLNRADLAEKLDEVEREWMDSPVWFGVRAMYEGCDKGIHTLMLYCSGNVSEYYNAFGKGSETLAEFEIRFKTVSGLTRQLQRIKRKVEQAF